MTADRPKTLIIHHDAAWRDRVAAMLMQRGFPCIRVSRWHNSVTGHAAPDVGAVAAQVSQRDKESVGPLIAGLRERWPGCIIIILVPAGDTATTRAAFRAGAYDCLEEPSSAREVVDCVTKALRTGPAPHTTPPGRQLIVHNDQTRLPEHSAFLDALGSLRFLCRRHSQPLSILIFDFDRFRELNERHSPAFGDRVLSWFAAVLHGVCRRSDLVARYHGDRFIVALPNSRASQATELADRCRRAMREESTTVDFRPPETTVSAGIAESTAGFIETEHQLIQRARIALDQAKRHGGDRTVSWSELLDAQPSRRALHQLTIDDVSHWVKRLRQHLRSTYVESTRALVAAVEAKDPFTQAHSLTVSTYAETIGKRMQLPVRMIETLRAAALLHDVGKIGVPDAILTKPGPLTTEEFDVIKRHPETALEILGHVSFLTDERPLILHHHERYDGTGYPTGLAGDRIPIGARILATADAVDTMFSPRSYKEPYAIDRVRAELTTGAGGQFDPTVTEVTLQWLDEAPADFPSAAVQARGSG